MTGYHRCIGCQRREGCNDSESTGYRRCVLLTAGGPVKKICFSSVSSGNIQENTTTSINKTRSNKLVGCLWYGVAARNYRTDFTITRSRFFRESSLTSHFTRRGFKPPSNSSSRLKLRSCTILDKPPGPPGVQTPG